MALVMRDSGTVPDDRWHYPIEGIRDVYAPNWPALYPEVERVCLANGIQPPSLQQVIDWCCRNLRIPCFDDQTRTPLANKWSMGLPVVLPGCCGDKKK